MPRAACLSFCLAAMLVLSSSSFLFAADDPTPKKPDPTPQQIAGWITALDANEFLDRETAMLDLLRAGPAVLPALRPVLTGGSLEAASRAFHVVRQLGLGNEEDAQEQVIQLLTDLSARAEAPVLARRASAALGEVLQARSFTALTELGNLGARVGGRQQEIAGLFIDPVQSIEIGEAFKGTENDLRRLKWIIDVPVLILVGKQTTDAWVKHAITMPSLVELHLYKASVTDAGLAPLAQHASIRNVGLYYTPVGDETLGHLSKLPLLTFVKLYGTNITDAGVEKYQESTSISVDHRRGAFLGVACQPVQEPCLINRVHPNTPAAVAGLMANDAILSFDGKGVKNFEELTELIRKCNVGDEVGVEVLRPVTEENQTGTKRITAKLKFTPWDVEAAVLNGRR